MHIIDYKPIFEQRKLASSLVFQCEEPALRRRRRRPHCSCTKSVSSSGACRSSSSPYPVWRASALLVAWTAQLQPTLQPTLMAMAALGNQAALAAAFKHNLKQYFLACLSNLSMIDDAALSTELRQTFLALFLAQFQAFLTTPHCSCIKSAPSSSLDMEICLAKPWADFLIHLKWDFDSFASSGLLCASSGWSTTIWSMARPAKTSASEAPSKVSSSSAMVRAGAIERSFSWSTGVIRKSSSGTIVSDDADAYAARAARVRTHSFIMLELSSPPC